MINSSSAGTVCGTQLGPVEVRWTSRLDGDFADPSGAGEAVAARRRGIIDRPWTWLRQVHGSTVVTVTERGGGSGREADAAVSSRRDVALAVVTADCAPVAFASPEGVVGVAHAGWRGLQAGVIEATVQAMRNLGARSVLAALGPCVHGECYAFGEVDLDALAARLGSGVRGETSDGRPALDIPAGVQAALAGAGAELVADAGICTACSVAHWSWRARAEASRQATVAWLR